MHQGKTQSNLLSYRDCIESYKNMDGGDFFQKSKHPLVSCFHEKTIGHITTYSKTCVKRPLSKGPKMVFKTVYCLKQVKSIAECLLSIFVKLPVVIKTFILSIFEWPLYTGFTVQKESVPLTS